MRNIYEMSLGLQEGPLVWCNSNNRGARVELLLQVGDFHLPFNVE